MQNRGILMQDGRSSMFIRGSYHKLWAAVLVALLFLSWLPDTARALVLDNGGPGYSETGAWNSTSGQATGEYGTDVRYTTQNGSTATWAPDIPVSGTYKVEYWVPADNSSNNSDNNALYRVNHANGSNTYAINQRNNTQQWRELGNSFCFQAGTTGSVVLTSRRGNNERTWADAMQFTLVTAGGCGTHTITAGAGAGGTINPLGPVSVVDGASRTFTITPNANYAILDVIVDGSSVGAGSSYPFNNVTSDHTIQATFQIYRTITATAGAGGNISPSGAVAVVSGTNKTFNISPNAGYIIEDVKVDGTSQGSVASYTFNNVTTNHTIAASFRPAAHTITATLTGNGTVSPVGAVSVADMGAQTFTITADSGFGILDVLVDGVSQGAIDTYSFTDVIEDHTILVNFMAEYKITASAGANGSIAPAGEVTVVGGTNKDFTIAANSGFLIATLLVDGSAVPEAVSKSNYTYTFENVTANHTIVVDFAVGYVITPTTTTGGTISPADPQEVAPGGSATFTMTPESCVALTDVKVDDVSVGPQGSYTFTAVAGDHNIAAEFAAKGDLSVTAVPGSNSTITPNGTTTVSCGSQQIFTVTWDVNLQDLYLLANNDSFQILANGAFQSGACVATGTPNECKYTIANVDQDYLLQLTEVFNMADYPLDVQTKPAPPNIMFVLDDSGSMDWEFMTTETDGKFNSEYFLFDAGDNLYGGYILDSGQRRMWKSQWFEYNKIYYNPEVTYTPWPNMPDAAVPPTATKSHPQETGTLSLSASYLSFDGVTIPRAHYYIFSGSENKPYLIILDYGSTSIKYYQVSATTNGTGSTQQIYDLTLDVTPPADIVTNRSYAADMQNFANWFTYFRRRELAATNAVATVINQISNAYVGIRTINGSSSYGILQPLTAVRASYMDVNNNLVYEDDSAALLNTLYGLQIDEKGTPLRRGLQSVGQYFNRADSDGDGNLGTVNPWFPWQLGGECQQSFAIVMTDGYWNGDPPTVSDADCNKGTPYQDDPNDASGGGCGSSVSNTLADVAMYYHERDLVSDYTGTFPRGSDANLSDKVPGSANHQHLVSYGVSFGVKGSLEQANPMDYYTLIPGCTSGCTYPDWPNPTGDDSYKIDDLWHASVNGRGLYVNASDPMELVQGLVDVINNISDRNGSAASVSVNGDELFMSLGTQVRMYQTRYSSGGWIGDIRAYALNADGSVATETPIWQAATLLDSDLDNGASVSGRLLATLKNDPSGPKGVPFETVTSLTELQQAAFGSSLTTTDRQKIMDYVRGSNAEESATKFRIRSSRLGDFVNSTAVYNDGYLYAGANDGMLHAFNATNGHEVFSYVPNLVIPNLTYLKDQNYNANHRFYVDNSPFIETMGEKTYLVGGLGKGGKGYYCLDVSNPFDGVGHKFDSLTKTELADMVKWEYPQANTPASDGLNDLGYSYSRAYTMKSYADSINTGDSDLAGYVTFFGNGYGSYNGNAVLYFLNPETGALIKKIDVGGGPGNGLSTPVPVDVNNDYRVDYLYAGDLKGNLWKFDVTSNDPEQWQVAYCDDGNDADSCKDSTQPQPLFTTAPNQSITMQPDVMRHTTKAGYMIVFGTGRFLDELDWQDHTEQAFYGIWDFGDDTDDTEYLGRLNTNGILGNMPDAVRLLEQTVVYEQVATTNELGETISAYIRVLTNNEADWSVEDDRNNTPSTGALPDPRAHVGWKFTLPLDGERATADPMIRDNKAILISFVLDNNRCSGGADSLVHEMNPMTGGRLDYVVFDINGNSAIGDGDYIHLDIDGDGEPDLLAPTATKRPGRIQPPAIIRKDDGTEVKYFSSSNASIQTLTEIAEKRGLYYWRENK
jgi:type IV pilus assembly protein PilY1